MIKNVIFDIGDVLVKSRLYDFLSDKGCEGEEAVHIAGATFESKVWKELDRGRWNFDEIMNGFVHNAPEYEAKIRGLFSNLNGFIKVLPYAEGWITALKESGLRVYCLSNISDKICIDCADELGFLKNVDGAVLSYKELLIKPDTAIFYALLDRYGLTAEECVFIDDLEENISSASSLGIHGIVFHNQIQADDEISAIRRNENE